MRLRQIHEMIEFLPRQNIQWRYGDCTGEVYNMVRKAVEKGVLDFSVVEGYVTTANGRRIDHVWIEQHDKVIDPTANQFGGVSDKSVSYPPKGHPDRDGEYDPIAFIRRMLKEYDLEEEDDWAANFIKRI